MQSFGRRLRANTYYLKRPFLDFLPLLLMMIGLIVLGGICFHNLYEQRQLTFTESFYTTYCLIFMEHLYEFPHHWVLQIFYFVLPPLGLLVVARIAVGAGSELDGKAIRDVGIDRHVIILSVERGSETTMFPTGEVELKTGDILTVQTEPPILKELHEINRAPSP